MVVDRVTMLRLVVCSLDGHYYGVAMKFPFLFLFLLLHVKIVKKWCMLLYNFNDIISWLWWRHISVCFLLLLLLSNTVGNSWKLTEFLCCKVNVKFDDIYDAFEYKYLKIAKNVPNFLKFFLILCNCYRIFIKFIIKFRICNKLLIYM